MNNSPSPHLPSTVVAERTHLQVPSRPEWIAPTVDYLKQKAVLCGACPEERAGKVLVALHEAITNAVVHGNLEVASELKEEGESTFAEVLAARAADPAYSSRLVEIEMDYDGDRCRWSITDQGRGFDVAGWLGRNQDDPEAFLRPSGRGILMMKAFLDGVEFEAGGRRIVLTLNRPIGGEKRRQPRTPVRQPVRVAPLRADGSVDWQAAYEAVAQNLSPEGIGILQARMATSGRVLIGIDWEGQVLYFPADVRHCRSLSGDAVELGCRFRPAEDITAAPARVAAQEEVQEAVGKLIQEAQADAVPLDDRRAHPRAVYTGRVGIQGVAPGEPEIGYARDLSRGGIAFLTTLPLRLGMRVLDLPQGDRPALRVRAEVLRCVPIVDGIYDIGARFLGLAHAARARQ